MISEDHLLSTFAVTALQHSSSREFYQNFYDVTLRNFKYLAAMIL